jgi:hypothetical protein
LVLARYWFNRQQSAPSQAQPSRDDPTCGSRIEPVAFATRAQDRDRAVMAMNTDRV